MVKMRWLGRGRWDIYDKQSGQTMAGLQIWWTTISGFRRFQQWAGKPTGWKPGQDGQLAANGRIDTLRLVLTSFGSYSAVLVSGVVAGLDLVGLWGPEVSHG